MIGKITVAVGNHYGIIIMIHCFSSSDLKRAAVFTRRTQDHTQRYNYYYSCIIKKQTTDNTCLTLVQAKFLATVEPLYCGDH